MTRMFTAWVVVVLLLAATGILVALSPQTTPQLPGTQVLSGSDVGFRLEGVDRSGNARGTWVVRVNDQWVPTVSVPKTIPPVSTYE
jgi:hypothetical protein